MTYRLLSHYKDMWENWAWDQISNIFRLNQQWLEPQATSFLGKCMPAKGDTQLESEILSPLNL